MELLGHLRKRQAEDRPIRLGLVGCGQEGSGMVHVTRQMAGMETSAIADIDVSRPLHTLQTLGIPTSSITVTDQVGAAEDALRRGHYVVTQDALLLPQLESLDALVEATGVTEVGAQLAWQGIMHKKHVVMLNVETDVTVGLILSRMAEKMGCVYTASTGDEPGVCKQLYDFAVGLGFEVVCLGKGKNNPIDFYATPDSCRAEAESKHMNPKMLAAFKDGTKTMVELAAMANATGLVPDVPGAHGPKVDVPDLNKVLVPATDGGILSRRGCVEYSVGKVAPGVFAIITSADAHIRADLKFYAMGDGPYYTLYRPFHLCSIETPQAVAEAVIYGEAVLKPQRMVAELVSVAKRDLKAGQKVDGIGGYDFFSRIYTAEEAGALHGIPMGLTPGGRVTKDIGRGELLTADNFAPDTTQLVYKLRQLQESLL
ncbi:MAG TPA: SAF domain-containing protein [Caldilinea sp.]|mgnify:FL=1|nr:SAF domain-containing protein [Caldilinea sp.]